MRRALLAIAGALAGCYSDRGLALEVDVRVEGRTDVPTSVELFIGNHRCADDNAGGIKCDDGIAPPDITKQLPASGGVWFRDDTVPFVAEVHGHTAVFRLQAGDADADVPIDLAIVVGKLGNEMVGTSTLTALTVPEDDALVVHTRLNPSNPIPREDGSTAGIEERVAVWGDPQTCVAIEHWSSGNVVRHFIVPEDDPDCDGLALANECNPAAFLGSLPPGSAARPNCVTDSAEPDVALGSRGCSDTGAPTQAACQAITPRVCMADSFAGCSFASSCAAAVTTDTPRLHCTLPARDGIFNFCPRHDASAVDLAPLLGARCNNGDAHIGSIQLTGFGTDHVFGGSKIEVALKNDCKLEVGWTDGSHTGGAGTDLGLIQIPNGTGGLLLPVELQFMPGQCSLVDVIRCELDPHPDDGLWDCAMQR